MVVGLRRGHIVMLATFTVPSSVLPALVVVHLAHSSADERVRTEAAQATNAAPQRKTHLACSLAVAACQAGHMTYYTSLDMVRKLRAADAAGNLSRQIRTYLRPDAPRD